MTLPRLRPHERLLVLALAVTLPLANPYPRGEGNGHYAYLPSLLLDGDLHFENEYRRGDADFANATFRHADAQPWPPMRMPTGYLRNQAPVGAALLWAPSFVQAHALELGLRELGVPVAADGYGLPYRVACALASALLAMLALLLACRTAETVAGPWPALLSVLALWLASPLPVYMYFLPFYGHAPAAFASALFLWYWITRRPLLQARQWAAWGAMGGLVFATDHMAAILLLAAPVEWLRQAHAARAEAGARGIWRSARQGASFAAAALLAALPELVAKWVLHGSPLRSGRLNRFFWDAPRLLEVGFSSQHGLFLWTPVLLLAVLGLVLLWRRDRIVSGTLLAVFGLTWYVVASYEAWHGSSSFGNRYFLPLTAAFALGLALLLRDAASALGRRLPAAWSRAALVAALALLAAWNLGFIFQWGTGMIPRQGPVDMRQVARNQATAVPRRAAAFALRYLTGRRELAGAHEGAPR